MNEKTTGKSVYPPKIKREESEDAIMIKIDEAILDRLSEDLEKEAEYKEFADKFYKALEERKISDIESFAGTMSALSQEHGYKKGFQEGIRFILDVMSGKEAIEIL